MYDNTSQLLGASIIALPLLSGIVFPDNVAIYVAISLFLILTILFFLYKQRNKKK